MNFTDESSVVALRTPTVILTPLARCDFSLLRAGTVGIVMHGLAWSIQEGNILGHIFHSPLVLGINDKTAGIMLVIP